MHTRPSVVGANSLPPDDGHRGRQLCPRPCSAWRPINNCHDHQPTQDQLDASSDGVIRLVTPVLALMLRAMAISFVAGDRPSPRANLLSNGHTMDRFAALTRECRHPSTGLRQDESHE
jgi:hypothetical protein